MGPSPTHYQSTIGAIILRALCNYSYCKYYPAVKQWGSSQGITFIYHLRSQKCGGITWKHPAKHMLIPFLHFPGPFLGRRFANSQIAGPLVYTSLVTPETLIRLESCNQMFSTWRTSLSLKELLIQELWSPEARRSEPQTRKAAQAAGQSSRFVAPKKASTPAFDAESPKRMRGPCVKGVRRSCTGWFSITKRRLHTEACKEHAHKLRIWGTCLMVRVGEPLLTPCPFTANWTQAIGLSTLNPTLGPQSDFMLAHF